MSVTVNHQEEINREYCIVNNWIDDPEKCEVFTHEYVDADAAFSSALLRLIKPDIILSFVPADTYVDDTDIIGLDMLNGSNSVKGLGQGSTFGLLVKVLAKRDKIWNKAFKQWAKQLNLTDSGKYCRDSLLFPQLINAWRCAGLTDYEMVDQAYTILSGYLEHTQRDYLKARAATNHPIEDGISVILEDQEIAGWVLFKRGAKVIIHYGESSGICVRLSPKECKKGRSLVELEGLLPEHWFIHPDGFIAAHGTKKAPKSASSGGISLSELIDLIDDWLSCPSSKEVDEIKAAIQQDLNWGEE